jgi:hypothetical protein
VVRETPEPDLYRNRAEQALCSEKISCTEGLSICFKEGKMLMLKLKQNIRWIIPLVLVAVVAAYFVLAPLAGAHAAVWGGQ